MFYSKFALAHFIFGNICLIRMYGQQCHLFISADIILFIFYRPNYILIFPLPLHDTVSILNLFYYAHNNADTWQRMVILPVMVVDLIVLEG